MSNMSYCRFRNTENDVEDCINALEDRHISSDEEKSSAKRMLEKVLQFCYEEGIIEGYRGDEICRVINECEGE